MALQKHHLLLEITPASWSKGEVRKEALIPRGRLTSGDLEENRRCWRPSMSPRETNSPSVAGSIFSGIRVDIPRDGVVADSEGGFEGSASGAVESTSNGDGSESTGTLSDAAAFDLIAVGAVCEESS